MAVLMASNVHARGDAFTYYKGTLSFHNQGHSNQAQAPVYLVTRSSGDQNSITLNWYFGDPNTPNTFQPLSISQVRVRGDRWSMRINSAKKVAFIEGSAKVLNHKLVFQNYVRDDERRYLDRLSSRMTSPTESSRHVEIITYGANASDTRRVSADLQEIEAGQFMRERKLMRRD
jgi:hypothetical protein